MTGRDASDAAHAPAAGSGPSRHGAASAAEAPEPAALAAAPAEKRNLLFVLPWSLQEIGGVNEVVRNLLACAEATGRWKSGLLVADFDSPVPRRSREGGVDTIRMRLRSPWLPGQSLRSLAGFLLAWPANLLRVIRTVGELRVDCINVHYPGPATLTLLVAVRLMRRRPRVLLSFHGADISAFASQSGLHRRLLRWMTQLADTNICCSHDLLALLRQTVGDPAMAGMAIHNGIDVERTGVILREGRRPPELEAAEYVANVATFEAKKGQDVLVRAFAKLRDECPTLKLVLAGRDGPWLDGIRTLVDEQGLRDRVVILTNLSHADALQTIAGSRLFVLCSRREPFGIVILEAAALNVPVVATSVGGVPEIVVDGETGVLVPNEDSDALAREIVRLHRDRVLADRLARGAAARVPQQFTWALAFRAYERLF